MKNKADSLREMTRDELLQRLGELRESFFNLKFQQVTGQLENTAQLKKTRKSIAQVLTVLSELDRKAAA